tara:strand:- start:10336 stop:10554 length:219 start_codon:yes stop_codon:yes gene_type:complete
MSTKHKVNKDSIHFMLDTVLDTNALWYLMSDEHVSEEMHGNFSFIVIQNNKKVLRYSDHSELVCEEYLSESL